MKRRRFMGINAVSAIGTALPAHVAKAEAVPADKIREPSRDLDVVDSSDIIILGGGPAGCAAAIAAGRLGAKVLLVERYGYLGGLSTGGLVLIVGEYDRRIKGLPAEFVSRLLESGESRYVAFANRRVDDEPIFCPETLKFICLDMTEKAGVRFLLHSWAVGVHVVNDRIDAVIVESKSGRQALRGKLIIDCTGDGDTAVWAGVPFETTDSSWNLGLDELMANVDFEKYKRFMKENPDEWKKIMAEASKENIGFRPWETWRNDRAWINTGGGGDPTDVRDLTRFEIDLRKRLKKHFDFFRKNMPGFENATVIQTASQIGTRVSRRIIGEHMITKQDLQAGKFPDRIGKILVFKGEELRDIPYRSLVPVKMNNLLYAGRCISSANDTQDLIRGITACWVYGQAAGVAAALSIKDDCSPRELDIGKIQAELRRQEVKI